jgi:hypothetical protein
MKITLIIVVLVILWSIWGYVGSRVDQTDYSVLEKKKDYEVRNYPAHIVAQTTVANTSYRGAMNSGFSIVARYIFGGNTQKQTIAMTAPVMVGAQGDSRVIAFGMPRSYTMETLPTPSDSRVTLREVPVQKMAVHRFSWSRSESRIQAMKDRLLATLARDGIEIIGSPSYAGYNAPWTPPWMMRNEVLVEVK